MSDSHQDRQRPADEPSQPFVPMAYNLNTEFAATPVPPVDDAGPQGYSLPPEPLPGDLLPPRTHPSPPPPAYSAPVSPGYGPGGGAPVSPPYGAPAMSTPPPMSTPPGYATRPLPPPSVPPAPPGAPRKRGRGLAIGLTLGGVLVLVCAVLCAAVGGPLLAEAGATVSAPDQLPGGLSRSRVADLQQLADELEQQLRNDLSATEVAAAFYADPKDPERRVLMLAAAALVLFPSSEVDDAFQAVGTGLNMSGNGTAYDPGVLEGHVRCGDGHTDNVPIAVCVWADHGTVGVGMFFQRTAADSATLFVQIRQAMVQR